MEELDKKTVGYTLSAVSTIVYMICVAVYWIFPNLLISYGNYIFHSADLGTLTANTVTFMDALIGLVLIFISSYLVGILFATLFNYFNKKY